MRDHHFVFQIKSQWPRRGNEPNIWNSLTCWWTSSITKSVPSYLLTTMWLAQRSLLITHECGHYFGIGKAKKLSGCNYEKVLENLQWQWLLSPILEVARLNRFVKPMMAPAGIFESSLHMCASKGWLVAGIWWNFQLQWAIWMEFKTTCFTVSQNDF